MKVFAVLIAMAALSSSQKPTSTNVGLLLEKLFTSNPDDFPTSPTPLSSGTSEDCTVTSSCYPSASPVTKPNNCKLTTTCAQDNSEQSNFSSASKTSSFETSSNLATDNNGSGSTGSISSSSSSSASTIITQNNPIPDCQLNNSCEDFGKLNTADAKEAVKSIFDCVLKNTCDFPTTMSMVAKMDGQMRSDLEVRINSAIDCVLSDTCEFRERNSAENQNLQENSQSESVSSDNGDAAFNDDKTPDCVLAGNCENVNTAPVIEENERITSFINSNNRNVDGGYTDVSLNQNPFNNNINNNDASFNIRNVVETPSVDLQDVRRVLLCILTNTCNIQSNQNNQVANTNFFPNPGTPQPQVSQGETNFNAQVNMDLRCVLYNICNNNQGNVRRNDNAFAIRRFMNGYYNRADDSRGTPAGTVQNGFYY